MGADRAAAAEAVAAGPRAHGRPARSAERDPLHGAQRGRLAAAVARTGTWKIEIVRRCDRHRFVVLPKRWIVV
jgi:hypothetical protein